MYWRQNRHASSSFEAAAPLRLPQTRVLLRERRSHHALADRLEYLGVAEVGDQQAERQRRRPRRAA